MRGGRIRHLNRSDERIPFGAAGKIEEDFAQGRRRGSDGDISVDI
jgi:hypothetical protein